MKKRALLWSLALLLTTFSFAGAQPAADPQPEPAIAALTEAALLQEILGTPKPQQTATCATTGWCTCFTNEECQSWCAGQCGHWTGYCNFSQGECGSCVCTAPVC